MEEAHNLTKKIIRKGDSYKATFRLALIFVHSQIKKGACKMIELQGTEKQVKWANEIRKELVSRIEIRMNEHLETIVGDKVKKSGKISTEAHRKQVVTNKFSKALDFIKEQTESTFFIENFRNAKEYSNWEFMKKLQSNNEVLNNIASYWQGR